VTTRGSTLENGRGVGRRPPDAGSAGSNLAHHPLPAVGGFDQKAVIGSGADLGVERGAVDAVVEAPVLVVQLQVQARGPLLHRLTVANVCSGVKSHVRARLRPLPLPSLETVALGTRSPVEYPTGGATRSPALFLRVADRVHHMVEGR
jgi:hypothetical protein